MLYGEHAKCQAEAEYPELWNGLVGAWSPCLSPRGGTILRDLSGRQNHGTLTNMDAATDWVTSGGKQALDFDGTNDYISISKQFSFGTDPFAISCWFSFSNTSGDQGVVSQFGAAGTWGQGWFIEYNSPLIRAVIRPAAGASAGKEALYTLSPQANALYHVVATRSASFDLTLFVNGRSVATASGASYDMTYPVDPAIGAQLVNGRYLNGREFDVVLYSSAVNATSLYNLGPGGWATPRRRRWNYATAQTAIPYWVFARKNARLIGGGVS